MFDAEKLLNQFLGAGAGETLKQGKDYLSKNAGTLASGAIAGGLGGYLLGSKGGRKVAKTAATYGGMALLAGLAYKAYSDYKGEEQPQTAPTTPPPPPGQVPTPPQDSAFRIDDQPGPDGFGATLVSAMIAAAKADGQIDSQEHQAIFDKIAELELGNEEKAFLLDQLNRPIDMDSLVAKATTREKAVEIYMASLMAITLDSAAEQSYLSMLAARLNLEPDLVAHIHGTLQQAHG
jgi:uncharacterized membrane protein YebE (DUF533 family)